MERKFHQANCTFEGGEHYMHKHAVRCSLKINGVRVVHEVSTCDAISMLALYLDPSPDYIYADVQKGNSRSANLQPLPQSAVELMTKNRADERYMDLMR
jgi:hypothetical protein